MERRARGCCEYCYSQVTYSPDPFNVEHVQPKSKAGNSDIENLAWSCFGCNVRKSTHTQWTDPLTRELVNLYNPRQDDWGTHFQWDSGYLQIIPLTGTGRATADLLELNRTGVVNLRRVLLAVQAHPPT